MMTRRVSNDSTDEIQAAEYVRVVIGTSWFESSFKTESSTLAVLAKSTFLDHCNAQMSFEVLAKEVRTTPLVLALKLTEVSGVFIKWSKIEDERLGS